MSLRLKGGSSQRPWRTAQSQTVFLMFTFFSLIAAGGAYVFVISRLENYQIIYNYTMCHVTNFFSVFILPRIAVPLLNIPPDSPMKSWQTTRCSTVFSCSNLPSSLPSSSSFGKAKQCQKFLFNAKSYVLFL